MSKLLKSELKSIVKECLVEILEEGISTSSERNIGYQDRNLQENSRRATYDRVEWSNNSADRENEVSHADYEEHARSLTDNKILAEVLADSQRTMRGQIAAENQGITSMVGDLADKQAASADPVELFGESAGNWAALAFPDR